MKLRHTLSIGRGGECDLRLADETVSRRHASLSLRADGRLRLSDLDSANGTWVLEEDGWRRLSEETLDPDREVRFGQHRARLRELLAPFPAFVLALEEEGSAGTLRLDDSPDDERLERPRRNPHTGEIEEQS